MRARNALFLTFAACGHPHGPQIAKPDVPPALTDLEVTAEHAYAGALAGNADALAADIDRIGNDWSSLRPEAGAAGVTPDLVDELDASVTDLGAAAARKQAAPDVARAANRISAALVEVYRVYAPARVPDVMQLDFLGRELALDGRTSDLRHADTDLAQIDSTWADLRPDVPAGHAASFDAAVQAAHAAVTSKAPAAIDRNAGAVSASVDDLEQLYVR